VCFSRHAFPVLVLKLFSPPPPPPFFFFFFETVSVVQALLELNYVVQAGLELTEIHLSLPLPP
jgi:hypothetical protein